jgi:hypothetical protein
MTCNQLMVLLDIYRGTFDPARHMDTVQKDLMHLFNKGLIVPDAQHACLCTRQGDKLVDDLLTYEPK